MSGTVKLYSDGVLLMGSMIEERGEIEAYRERVESKKRS